MGALYLSVIGFALLMTSVASFVSGEPFWGGFVPQSRGQGIRFLVETAFLREGSFGTDVLIAYLSYVAIAVPILLSLKRWGAWPALVFLALFYAASQLSPEATALPFASFRHIAANSPVFLGAMLLGYYRNEIRDSVTVRRARPVVDGLVIPPTAWRLVALHLLHARHLDDTALASLRRDWRVGVA